MKPVTTISVFEHERLYVGEKGFKQTHLNALLKLNELHDGNYFDAIANGIKFKQYVGIIQVDKLSIEINPKADKYDDSDKWKGVLLQMLTACGRLKPSSMGKASVQRQDLNLLEVYFELYLNEVELLLHQGLVKKYRSQTRNVKAYKGKLEFAGHIANNLVHKERFYTTHQTYDANHLLNQTLSYALSIVEQFTRGTRLYDHCKRVQLGFPVVDPKIINTSQLNSIKLDRKTEPYSYGLELARLIILNFSPDISTGSEQMLSLLFDMNDLWEEYILKLLKNEAEVNDFMVLGQVSKPFWGLNTLRPDILIEHKGKNYIIDTKWKTPGYYSASIDDLRQMYAYCRFWDAEKALLLYPGEPKGNTFKTFDTEDYSDFEDETRRMEHRCKMGFVSVVTTDGSLNKTCSDDIIREIGL